MSAGPVFEALRTSRLSDWDRWLRTAHGSNFRQSSHYHDALRRYGYDPVVVAAVRNGELLAGASLAFKRLPLTPWTVAHVSGGIPVAEQCDADAFAGFLEGLRTWSARRHAVMLEVSLRLPPDSGASVLSTAAAVLRGGGFAQTERLATYFIDLRHADDESLLAGFGPNPRRHIRRAARDGLIVQRSEQPEDFEAFQAGHTAMCRRKGMTPLPRGFAKDVLLPAARADAGDLFVAKFRDIARNFLYVGRVGTPVYNWGAVVDAAWDEGCPPTGQALHFAAMCRYRRDGHPFYDFGGTPGPVPERDDPNYSVWRFKYEFQGRYVEFQGVWTTVLDRTGAEVLRISRDAIGRMRRLGRSNPTEGAHA